VFDLSILKVLVLGVLALVIFGPDQLPKMAAQAGKALRDLRRLADVAKSDLAEGLGPEFRDFDINDLHPRNFVRKHFWDELDGEGAGGPAGPGGVPSRVLREPAGSALLAPGERPPYDSEAT
jgi:sec-independent protein translocase protein TatB